MPVMIVVMKSVYLLRHGHKDVNGNLTTAGKKSAVTLKSTLPHFTVVVASGYARAIETAQILSGQDPRIDDRAGYPMAPQDVSDAINALAAQKGTSFLEAAQLYKNAKVLSDIHDHAQGLNGLIDELLDELADGQKALVVSHDITIVPAMSQRGLAGVPIEPLGGYVVSREGARVRLQSLRNERQDKYAG